MTETTEEERKEATPQDMFPEDDLEFLGYYSRVRDELLVLVREQESTIVRTNHVMGNKIVEATNYLRTKYEVTGSKGHTGKVGKLMDKLADDLDRGHTALYDCKAFAEKCPKWEEFADSKFWVTRRGSDASETPTQVSGKDMSWREVLEYIVRESNSGNDKKERKQTHTESSKHTIKVSSAEQVFVIPLPQAEVQRFRQIAIQRGELPDQILANGIRKYVERYGK